MSADSGSDIREGFLCPICMKDLSSVYQLQAHFDDVHSAELGDKDVVHQLKGFFGKAKKKILQKIEGSEAFGAEASQQDEVAGQCSDPSLLDAGGVNPGLWDPQEIGSIRSHSDTFCGMRSTRIDWFVVETNKLLIRLEKLLSYESSVMDPMKKNMFEKLEKLLDSQSLDPTNKRKAFEKSIVPWAPDEDVKYCPTCGDKFSLAKRKHHCRLCGSIMCGRCSDYLSYTRARMLTNLCNPSPQHRRPHQDSAAAPETDEEMHFRICFECQKILNRKEASIEERTSVPVIVKLYEKLRVSLEDIESVLPVYVKMADSLNLGETAYNLDMATDVRMKLLKMYEIMDIISKKILVLGMSGENRATQTEQRLQRMIRQYVTSYLQDNMVTLQALPSRDQYERLKLEREAAIARRLEKQKQAAIEAQRQEDERRENEKRKQERFSFMTHQLSTSPSHSRDGVSTERSVAKESVGKEGWEPTQLPVAASASDPMLLQMDIIRNYIQQARNAQKLDEVKMLESNLHELQSEYWKQKQSNVQNKINQL